MDNNSIVSRIPHEYVIISLCSYTDSMFLMLVLYPSTKHTPIFAFTADVLRSVI